MCKKRPKGASHANTCEEKEYYEYIEIKQHVTE